MLGWIALTLILWLGAVMRTIAAPRLAVLGAAAPSFDAASFEPDPVIDRGSIPRARELANETKAPSRDVLRHPELDSGSSWSPVRKAKDWMLNQVQHDGWERAIRLRRRFLPTSAPPPLMCLDEGGNRSGMPQAPWTKPLSSLD